MTPRWRFAWSWIVGAVLVLAGCSIITKPCVPPCAPGETCVAGVCVAPPPPKECPASCPLGSACTDPAKGCEPIPAPGPVCQEGQHHSCWHWPREATSWLYACPVYDASGGVIGVQNETDPAKCPAKPEPPAPGPVCPLPGQGADPSKWCGCWERSGRTDGEWKYTGDCPTPPPPTPGELIPDEELTQQDPQDGKRLTWPATEAAIARFKRAHPEKWRADGACLIDGAAGIDAAFGWIAIELKSAGVAAGQSITKSGQRSDCIFVNRTSTNLWEETHLFDYARGCVATGPNAIKGVYVRGASPPPPPQCPFQPCPLKVFADTGAPHWKFNAKPHTMQNCDSTPVEIKNCPYCKAIGMGELSPGVPRCDCPVRPDDHPERRAVEAWLLDGGAVRDSRNGQDCRPNNTDNPMAFLCGTGNCRNCNSTRTVCTVWF